jgi:hypothetical protein
VRPVQVAGKLDDGRGDAADQRDVLIFTLLVGQLEARLPIADRLATP